MKRTEALEALRKAQDIADSAKAEWEEAKYDVFYAQQHLAEAECDHPDTHGHVCDHCGEYETDPETREQEDFLRVMYADEQGLIHELGHRRYNWSDSYPTPAYR